MNLKEDKSKELGLQLDLLETRLREIRKRSNKLSSPTSIRQNRSVLLHSKDRLRKLKSVKKELISARMKINSLLSGTPQPNGEADNGLTKIRRLPKAFSIRRIR